MLARNLKSNDADIDHGGGHDGNHDADHCDHLHHPYHGHTIIITIIINIMAIDIRFLASDFCLTYADERCPEFLEDVLRQGIPALVQSSNPDEYPQVFIRAW